MTRADCFYIIFRLRNTCEDLTNKGACAWGSSLMKKWPDFVYTAFLALISLNPVPSMPSILLVQEGHRHTGDYLFPTFWGKEEGQSVGFYTFFPPAVC